MGMTKMTVSEIIEVLSPEARRVLERMNSDRIGVVTPASPHRAELLTHGVIGVNGGLTIKGSAVVCKIKPADAF
jgi:hypothetical protein